MPEISVSLNGLFVTGKYGWTEEAKALSSLSQLGKLKWNTGVMTLRSHGGGQCQKRYLDQRNPWLLSQAWTMAAHKAAMWGFLLQHNHAVHKERQEGFPLPLLTKKCPYISRLRFRAPSAAVWWGSTPAWALVMGVGGRMLLLGTGGGWGDRGLVWGAARNVAKHCAHRSTDAWINCLLFTAWVYCSAFN